jgi:glycosyltransferase involved in cell wall biosynthesis
MSAPPAVSVLMPVYNAGRYLADAVQSILDQTFADFELIAVDDGSTDSSKTTLDAFAKRDARVRVISRPNTGIVGALNDAIAAARGEFLARMDGDDLSLPTRFEKQVAFLRENPAWVLVGTRVIMMDADGCPIGDMRSVAAGHETIDSALMNGGWPIVHPTVMMRADAVRKVNGYRPGTFPNEDHDLFLRLAEVGRLENFQEPLLRYRRHIQSVVFSGRHAVVQQMIDAARERRGLGPGPIVHPGGAPPPVWQQQTEWVWIALKNGHVATARKHALGVLKAKPLWKSSWRTMYCALRGR